MPFLVRAGLGVELLEVFEHAILRYSPFDVEFTFKDYIRTLTKGLHTRGVDKTKYIEYEEVFTLLTDFKKDYFYKPEYFYFIVQLLYGIRAGEFLGMRFSIIKDSLCAWINCEKGSKDREIMFPRTSPLVNIIIKCLDDKVIRLSYKNYYRSLLRANPNYFIRAPVAHLKATHLMRHFLVQVLYYVLKLSPDRISVFMGWYCSTTIESYTDTRLFL